MSKILYNSGTPVKDPKKFFGFKKQKRKMKLLLDESVNNTSQNFLFCSERSTGKVVFKYYKGYAREKGYLVNQIPLLIEKIIMVNLI